MPLKFPEDFINKIICADCMDILPLIPDGAVDCVVTDPPYGIGEASGTKGKVRSHKFEYNEFEDSPEYIRSVCVPAIRIALSKAGGRGIVTPGSLNFCEYPNPDSFGSLIQPSTCSMQKWGRADSQPLFYYGKDPRSGLTIQFCSYKNTERPSVMGHPCAKPMQLWSKIVQRASLENEIVLDPFAGSGTTLVAAKQLGRRYVGIEISEKYCAIARERLKQEELFSATNTPTSKEEE